jgi:hypothetical protein
MSDDFQGLADKLAKVPAELERQLKTALGLALTKAVADAKENHTYKDRSGFLTNSIQGEGPTGSFTNDDLTAILTAGASYASYVELGTRPHVIRARHRTALRWPVAGGFGFAKSVQHPGTQGTFFLKEATERAEKDLAERLIPQAVELAFLQSGFEAD